MTFTLSLAVLACALTVALGEPVIRLLVAWRIGKGIRPEGPATHSVKQGIPTLGGVIFLLPVLAVTLAFHGEESPSLLIPLGTLVACGTLGALDDLLGLVGGSGTGLRAWTKMAALTGIGLAVAAALSFRMGLDAVSVPGYGYVALGLGYLPAAALVLVATANAVNLTDGLDGLAAGTTALAFLAYGIIAWTQGQAALAAFALTVVGGLLGFLWYNAYPARAFMGDAGSLALGGVLATVALMSGQWLVLPVVGAVFVAEAGSVILQVAYFKATGGRRILRMSPLHHHFELAGWPEAQVTVRFWVAGAAAALAGVALAQV